MASVLGRLGHLLIQPEQLIVSVLWKQSVSKCPETNILFIPTQLGSMHTCIVLLFFQTAIGLTTHLSGDRFDESGCEELRDLLPYFLSLGVREMMNCLLDGVLWLDCV